MYKAIEHLSIWLKYADIWYLVHILILSFNIQNKLERVVKVRHK